MSVRRMGIQREEKQSEGTSFTRELVQPFKREIKERIVVEPPVVDVRAIRSSTVKLLEPETFVEAMRGEKFSFAREVEHGSAHEGEEVAVVVQKVAQTGRAGKKRIHARHRVAVGRRKQRDTTEARDHST